MLYLIHHKVRGTPTFDVAEKIQIGTEVGWIIPTSGHRAYPSKVWLLSDFVDTAQPLAEDLRDHYAVNNAALGYTGARTNARGKIEIEGKSLLRKLGL